MNKYKIIVETKSRSQVVIPFESTDETTELKRRILDAIQTDSLMIGDHIFKSSNVNYVKVEIED